MLCFFSFILFFLTVLFFALKGGGGGDVFSLKNSYLGNLAVLMGWKNMS